MKRFAFFVALFLVPFLALAHGTNFFEFAPDISEPLRFFGLGAPSQALVVPNDFLSGVDLFIDNQNISGAFTLELRTEGGALIASRTATMGSLPAVWAGNRFHINFLSQVPIIFDTVYRLNVTSAPPELSLYRADRSELLQHNASYFPTELPLPAYLGETEQPFTFKYALYETQEETPPVITGASTTIISHASVQIDFHANEPVDARIAYGPQGQGGIQSTAYTGAYTSCPPSGGLCTIRIGTEPLTAYEYTLFARDEWGNESNVGGTFVTPEGPTPVGENPPPPPPVGSPPPPPPPPPQTPPTIVNARVVDFTHNSVHVVWDTNEAANSELQITLNGSVVATIIDSVFELTHSIQTGAILIPQTAYTALVRSTDLENISSSLTLSFTTSAAPATPPGTPPPPVGEPPPAPLPPPPQPNPPLPPGTSPPPTPPGSTPGILVTTFVAQGSGSTNATPLNESVRLDWSTLDAKADEGFRVDVFNEDGTLAKQYTLARNSTELTIDDLRPGIYSAIVYGKNEGVYTKIADPVIFEIRGPSSFSVAARIWFTILMAGLILGTGTLILLARRKHKTKEQEVPPRRTFLYE